MSRRTFGDYYLGLDIGTDSVGWAVTDLDYNVEKFNGKAMWGIRLFDAATPAADRRSFRVSRRRTDRRQNRIKIVQELLGAEVEKVDPCFFLRLQESKYHIEDKDARVRQKYTLFADQDYTDYDYHKEFPTIYHLRKALMDHERKFDIRLYYLAISDFMKHRGHFLFPGDVGITSAASVESAFSELNDYLEETMDFRLEPSSTEKMKEILLDRRLGILAKKRELYQLFGLDQSKAENLVQQKEMIAAICGATVSLDKLFADESYKDAEISKFSFADGVDDAKEAQLNADLKDQFALYVCLKAVYSAGVLANILGDGNESISKAQIGVYEKHKKDLKILKDVVRRLAPDLYHDIFVSSKIKENYPAYVAHSSRKNEPVADKRITEQKDFCDFIKKKLGGIKSDDPQLAYVRKECESYTFMPKQISKSNSVIPYQIHLSELKQILNNMGKDYPELSIKDSDELSVCDKIEKTFVFRIPYYVGPLNTYHSDKGGNSWAVRKEDGKIYPWNFDEKIDKAASAEKFIRRMTNKCTYLVGEDVIAKDSLLYARFMVLNELNNLRINGERISVDLKQKIYAGVFEKEAIRGKITLQKLKKWMIQENLCAQDSILSGVDNEFKSSLRAYHDFYRILGNKVNKDPLMVEDIILNIVIFGEDKKLLTDRIMKLYGNKISIEQMKKIKRLQYSGWGRLSRKFLNGIEDVNHETGEIETIIQAMWNGQENLEELLSRRHDYMNKVREENKKVLGDRQEISYKLVQESYASPAVKRGIWQTLLIVKEIRKITGRDPKRIFIEVAKAPEENKTRKASRKNQLLERYKNISHDKDQEWIDSLQDRLNKQNERDLASKKLYLYYMQLGRDMYSGERIDLNELFTNAYDIDHIYPQSKTKDDSLINNMVLVKSNENREKGDTYPISEKFRQVTLWKLLKDKSLISERKFERLMRRDEFSVEELAGFLSRQLVETRQTTKVVAEILEECCPGSKIVYSKANAVSKFRQDNQFVKCRSVNDYHHAKDAYLNVVVGNVYYTKFTDNPIHFINDEVRKKGVKYSLNKMFDFPVERNGVVAWRTKDQESLNTVKKYMKKNNILFTRYATEKRGGFFDQMPLKKGSGQLLPLKSSDVRMDTEKYGGYNKPSIDYYMLVVSKDKKGEKRTIEGVPVYLAGAEQFELKRYCQEALGLKDVEIRLPKIKINTLFVVDGYPMHLSGKTGKRLAMKNGVQLCISPEEMQIVKKIENVVEKSKTIKNYEVTERDGVSEEDTRRIFDLLKEKAGYAIFSKRPASQKEVLQKGTDKFDALSLLAQCSVIMEILHLFQCRFITADLQAIGGVKQAGIFTIGNDISKHKSVYIINQSVTGLFEERIDLLTL
jgi:CRISPR-associated endonuclease Csn1